MLSISIDTSIYSRRKAGRLDDVCCYIGPYCLPACLPPHTPPYLLPDCIASLSIRTQYTGIPQSIFIHLRMMSTHRLCAATLSHHHHHHLEFFDGALPPREPYITVTIEPYKLPSGDTIAPSYCCIDFSYPYLLV